MTKRELIQELNKFGVEKRGTDAGEEVYVLEKFAFRRMISFDKGTSRINGMLGLRYKELYKFVGKKVSEIPNEIVYAIVVEFKILKAVLDHYSKAPEQRTFICSFMNDIASRMGKKPEDFNGILGHTDLTEVKDFDIPKVGIQFLKREFGHEKYTTDDPKQIMDIHDGMFMSREMDEDIYNYLLNLSKKENIYVIGVRRKDNIFPNTLISEL